MADKYKEFKIGVYEATIEEDFIDTVRKFKRPILKAKISPLYDSARSYPYTKVPPNFFMYPLKKKTKVLVCFWERNITQPILLSVMKDIPSFIEDEKYAFPANPETFDFPDSEKSFSYQYYSNNFYMLCSDHYMVIHNSDKDDTATKSVFVIANGKIINYGKVVCLNGEEIFIEGTDVKIKSDNLVLEVDKIDNSSNEISFETLQSFKVKNTGTLDIESNAKKLKDLLGGIQEILNLLTTSMLDGEGMPCTALPSVTAKIVLLLADINTYFG